LAYILPYYFAFYHRINIKKNEKILHTLSNLS